MKKATTKKSSGAAKLVTRGALLAGLAATAYFFLGPQGKKNQKYAKAWAIRMKGDVVEKLETAREVSESTYHGIIDSVATKHQKVAKVNHEEIKELAQDLKKHWKTISSPIKAMNAPVKTVKKSPRA